MRKELAAHGLEMREFVRLQPVRMQFRADFGFGQVFSLPNRGKGPARESSLRAGDVKLFRRCEMFNVVLAALWAAAAVGVVSGLAAHRWLLPALGQLFRIPPQPRLKPWLAGLIGLAAAIAVAALAIPVAATLSSPAVAMRPTPVPPTATPEPVPKATAHAAASDYEAAHRARLELLDPVFRSSGFEPWLRQAGFTWSSLTLRTDQVIEETWSGRQWASGVPVNVTGLNAPWPAAITTDVISIDGRCIEVGPSSKLCTDVTGFSGRATLYVDVQNWGQLAPPPDPAP